MRQCDNCYFGKPGNPGVVICQRYPPTITEVEGKLITSHFPLVNSTGWCGEWKPGGSSLEDKQGVVSAKKIRTS